MSDLQCENEFRKTKIRSQNAEFGIGNWISNPIGPNKLENNISSEATDVCALATFLGISDLLKSYIVVHGGTTV